MRKKFGFAKTEPLFLFTFFLLLVSGLLFAFNPTEKAQAAHDKKQEAAANDVLFAISQYFVSVGRLPWALDLATQDPNPKLSWTKASDSKIGGKLLATRKLSPDFFASQKFTGQDTLYIAKGEFPQDSVYACFVPKSYQYRSQTGKLYKININSSLLPPRGLGGCPVDTTWRGEDVCWVCVSK